MADTRKMAVILATDVAGFSGLVEADEDRVLSRLRTLWSDVIYPLVDAHSGRVFKRTGDGIIVEFRSPVEAVRCGLEMQREIFDANSDVPEELRLEFRVGIHLSDVVEELDGDLMGDGVNVASRLEAISDVGGICISEDAFRHLRGKTAEMFTEIGEQRLKNISRPIRAYRWTREHLAPRPGGQLPLALPEKPSIAVLPFQNMSGDPEQEYFADGMVEDITTGLSRIRWLFVIARNSSFIYKISRSTFVR